MNTKMKYSVQDLLDEFGELTFASLLKSLREDAEFSQKDFALKLGISPQRLNDFEKGRRLPDIKSAINFARRLKDSEHFFIQILFQDYLRSENLNFEITISKKGA